MGSLTLLGAGKPPSGAAAYVGPGDINGTAYVWYGLRGLSAAFASPGTGKAITIVDQAGANSLDVVILSNGNLDVASVSAWITANSVSTTRISKLWDQSGSGFHLTAPTLAKSPVLTLSSLGAFPGMTYDFFAPSTLTSSAGVATLAQPFTMSAVANHTANNGNDFILADTTGIGIGSAVTVGKLFVSGGNVPLEANGSDSSPHAMQALVNNAAASMYVDGSLTSGSGIGTSGWSSSTLTSGAAVGNQYNGVIYEFGAWATDKTANNSTMNSNQHTYWNNF